MNYLSIENVVGREILDSRGNPTVEAEVSFVTATKADTLAKVFRRLLITSTT